jgi:hypothetical protein
LSGQPSFNKVMVKNGSWHTKKSKMVGSRQPLRSCCLIIDMTSWSCLPNLLKFCTPTQPHPQRVDPINQTLFPVPPISGDWVTNHESEADGWQKEIASCFALTEGLTAKTLGLKYNFF